MEIHLRKAFFVIEKNLVQLRQILDMTPFGVIMELGGSNFSKSKKKKKKKTISCYGRINPFRV